MDLNALARPPVERLLADADALRVKAHVIGGATVIDCGVASPGSHEAGQRLAEIGLAGLASVELSREPLPIGGGSGPGGQGFAARSVTAPAVTVAPTVTVATDEPLAACLASQYAGWRVEAGDYFAMASGPMRVAAAKEPLLQEPAFSPCVDGVSRGNVVGVLEASSLPTADVCGQIADACGVTPERLALLVAPTNSPAGVVQIAARAAETAMHKLHELGFDLSAITAARGSAPIPPHEGDALTALGRTNDAVLYGGHAVLSVRGVDDATLADFAARTPSSASPAHGRPFGEIFRESGHDFYAIDPLLFSPAVIEVVNTDTGQTHRRGRLEPEVLARSFGGGG